MSALHWLSDAVLACDTRLADTPRHTLIKSLCSWRKCAERCITSLPMSTLVYTRFLLVIDLSVQWLKTCIIWNKEYISINPTDSPWRNYYEQAPGKLQILYGTKNVHFWNTHKNRISGWNKETLCKNISGVTCSISWHMVKIHFQHCLAEVISVHFNN